MGENIQKQQGNSAHKYNNDTYEIKQKKEKA